MTDTIQFDKVTALNFRAAYRVALADHKEVFIFQDKEVLTSYAKYLCEYLVMQGLLPNEISPK